MLCGEYRDLQKYYAKNSHVNPLAKNTLICIYRRKVVEEMIVMPNIKPISDLRNYTEILK